MRLLKPSLILVAALSPVVGLVAGCGSDKEAAPPPLPKIEAPPQNTAKESGKSKVPAKGISRSPDVLPGPPK
jgi:hypothetical protein